MKTKVKVKKLLIKNTHGSAIVMAIMSMVVLVLVGLAVATISMGVMRSNTADANTNDAYYAAESGVNSAIEQLKYETTLYYYQMLNASYSSYNSLYNNFFNNINSYAQSHFLEPDIEGVTTATTFTPYAYDSANEICEYHVSCQADHADGNSYIVNGKLFVKRVDVGNIPFLWISDDAALKAGGTLDLESKNSVTVDGGNILVANLAYVPNADGSLPYSITGGELIFDPFLSDKIQDLLIYPSFDDPVIPYPDVYVPSGGTVDWATLTEPISVVTEEGADMHFANCTIPSGTVYIQGNLNLNNCVVYADIYCDGNVSINNYTSLYGNIYARGNVLIDNAQLDGEIFSDGYVDYNNGNLSSSIYAQSNIVIHNGTSTGNLFSPGEITIENAEITNGIVYSKTKLTVGTGDMNAIFFSGGNIEFTGDVFVDGTVIAKNDIYFKVDANKDLYVNYQYSEETIEQIISDPDNGFFFIAPGEGSLDEEVIISQSITPAGRVN